MVPKTERFEMRLDPAILDRVDAWRSEQGDLPSRAEAIRRLVEASLVGTSSGPFQPGNSEKLVIWLLTEILKNQKGYEDQETVKLIQEALYGGHFWALEWEMTGLLHKHVDNPAAVTLVVDTLDMWSFIESAWVKSNKADKARIAAGVGTWFTEPKFIGFDGNNEGEYLGIARFLINKMGRFESFKGRDLNSHSPKVANYRHMIDLFEPIRAGLVGRELGVDEIITLLRRE